MNNIRTETQKEQILQQLRDRGCRITKQRLVLLDIILSGDYSSCKEIYYAASKIDSSIGNATVYRLISLLEEIGAIDRRPLYKIASTNNNAEMPADTYTNITAVNGSEHDIRPRSFIIKLKNASFICISPDELRTIVAAGLHSCGYGNAQDVTGILVK